METRTAKLFEIFGFQIKVHASWFLVAALIVWSLASGFFPQEAPGLTRTDYLALSVAGMLGLFGSLILHELAHSLVARHFGLGVGAITLFIFGGVAELDEEPLSPKSEFWMALAGPATSFALAMLAFLFELAAANTQQSPAFSALLSYLFLVNTTLAIFNLIPGFPLDGGRILRAALWHRWRDLIRATRVASRIGEVFAYLLISFGFVVLFLINQFDGLWLILIGLFLLSAARATFQHLVIRSALADKTVAALMTPSPWTADPDQTLSDLVEGIMLPQSVSFVPVCEGDHLLGHIDGLGIQRIDRENWTTTRVSDVFTPAGNSTCIPPDMLTERLMQKMMQTGQRKFMVVQQHRLLGVITLSDLLSYLSVLHEVGGLLLPITQIGKPQK
jgi:Zn-dependent protease/CBS domain-containing protein